VGITVAAGPLGALVLCAVASALDVKSGRIPNILTLGAALAGLVVAAALEGLSGLGHATAGWAVGCVLFLPFFLLGGMGAGDVKLLAAVGAWLGPSAILFVALYAGLAGGVMAVIVSVTRGYIKQLFTNLWGLVIFWRIAGLQPMPGLTLRTASSPRLPYALPISAGTVAALWFR
jgi:prepilin peptidase CpaA